jgi:hypothetical protein
VSGQLSHILRCATRASLLGGMDTVLDPKVDKFSSLLAHTARQ